MVDECRKAFEHHARNPQDGGYYLGLERSVPPFDEEDYHRRDSQIAWLAWQAAWASKPQQPVNLKMLTALKYAVSMYGRPGGPWNVPSDPGGWIETARWAIRHAEQQLGGEQ